MVTSPSFIDNLGLIALRNLVKKRVKSFEKVAYIVLEWGLLNAVTFNISKTKAIPFSKLHRQ